MKSTTTETREISSTASSIKEQKQITVIKVSSANDFCDLMMGFSKNGCISF